LLRLFSNFSFAQELMPGKVGMISGLFWFFGMGGLGSAFLGYLADQTSIEYVYKISSIYL
jgi:FSR family fosmidomycin resistance protein-like MFS transporter